VTAAADPTTTAGGGGRRPDLLDVAVPVRDGTVLRADVHLPDGRGPHPTLLAASPYQKALRHLPAHPQFPFRETGPIGWYVERGYAYVWLDLRGTGTSGGDWTFGGTQEACDVHDAVEWAAAQPWSNGRVGMIGQSYFAMTQWNAARLRPPHLACIAPYDGNVDVYRDFLYHGGIPSTGFAASWSARLALLHRATGRPPAGPGSLRDDLLGEVLRHPTDDDWMRDRSPFWQLDRTTTPVLSIGCWGKGPLHLRGNVLGYLQAGGPKKLLVTGAAGVADAQGLFDDPAFHAEHLLPWYEHHLKNVDNGVLDGPPVRVWVGGLDEYRDLDAWPPPAARPRALWLSGDRAGAARSINDGRLTAEPPAPGAGPAATSWSYPHPSWRRGVTALGPGGRPDHDAGVTTWTGEPLAHDLEITGHAVLELWLSSDQRDADVHAKLRDVPPGPAGTDPGRPAPVVTQGWLRASHRAEDPRLGDELRPFHTHRDPAPLVPGRPYRLRVELLPMSHVVRAGHRLRLDVTNGDSPLADGAFTHDYGTKVGTDTYHHDAAHPSRLLLPVVG
jgi:hypothetical protein